MNSILPLFLLCICGIWTFGCRSSQHLSVEDLQGSWQCHSFLSGDSQVAYPESIKSCILDFDESRLSMDLPCNSGGGKFSITKPNTIRFYELYHTEMYCPGEPMKWEERILSVLNNALDFDISESTLTLKNAEAYVLVFRKKN